jgi:hypothetical protein
MAGKSVESRRLRTLLKWYDRTRTYFEGVTSLKGPVELIRGQLILRIPLAAGGARLRRCARSISRVEGDFLEVTIPAWLAEKIKISEGTVVAVDNRWGKFNITVCDEADTDPDHDAAQILYPGPTT